MWKVLPDDVMFNGDRCRHSPIAHVHERHCSLGEQTTTTTTTAMTDKTPNQNHIRVYMCIKFLTFPRTCMPARRASSQNRKNLPIMSARMTGRTLEKLPDRAPHLTELEQMKAGDFPRPRTSRGVEWSRVEWGGRAWRGVAWRGMVRPAQKCIVITQTPATRRADVRRLADDKRSLQQRRTLGRAAAVTAFRKNL